LRGAAKKRLNATTGDIEHGGLEKERKKERAKLGNEVGGNET